MSKTTLVVMAAGMGSRFGGLKQIEPIGKNGEVIIDYSAYDAIKAGFDKIVFIIKKEIENDFKRIVGDRIATKIEVEYVYQESPEGRSKPYGTAHAILCCKDVVKTPFVVINADDFYGATAFEVIHNHLITSTDYAMVGFALENTVTENGTVARGICEVVDGYLTNVKEHTAIPKDNDFPKNTIVSMNMWGFMPSIFEELSIGFENFLETANLEKDEYFIPSVVDDIIKNGKAKVRVLTTPDKWYGVTYKDDKEDVVMVSVKWSSSSKPKRMLTTVASKRANGRNTCQNCRSKSSFTRFPKNGAKVYFNFRAKRHCGGSIIILNLQESHKKRGDVGIFTATSTLFIYSVILI